MRLLDVATGTGLMIKAALELGVAPELVTGVDPSRGMLAENRKRNPVTFAGRHGEALRARMRAVILFAWVTPCGTSRISAGSLPNSGVSCGRGERF